MRKLLSIAALSAAAMVALPGTASAATCVLSTCTFIPGDDEFETVGDTTPPITGGVTATIGRAGMPAGVFDDTYTFIVDIDGIGSGSITTSLSGLDTDIDFTEVLFNGATVPIVVNGGLESAGLENVIISNGFENTLIVRGIARGTLGSYGGNLTFTPGAPVPEPAAWAMMLIGFGGLGFVMRRGRKSGNYKLAFS